jgi:putative molybdopterin biosynthesis protein
MERDLLDQVRAAARQEQFLHVLDRDAAFARWWQAIAPAPLAAETVALDAALGRVLKTSVAAPVDVPAFDRSLVDGFAVRAADCAGASAATPVVLRLNPEIIRCGHAPSLAVAPGTASLIATGGMIPRGADAVVMIEQTEPAEGPDGPVVQLRRAAAPGAFIGYAGADIARGEIFLRAGHVLDSRAIGMLAAVGIAELPVVRRPVVAVLSTGDELIAPGEPPRPGGVFDSNARIIAAAVAEAGGVALPLGIVADDFAALDAALCDALRLADLVLLSGGTSKGAGDLSFRVLDTLPAPGVLVHGVALKPGKPLCLALAGRTPVAVLPGFPTSAIFCFHAFIAPVIRALAGQPAEAQRTLTARLAQKLPSELGRTEYAMVGLAEDAAGTVAWPLAKGSGAVTAFSLADGFLEIPALADHLPAGAELPVTLIGSPRPPDLALAGSHCVGLDVVLDFLAARGVAARVAALGSQGGLAAARRGECDLAPTHLLDAATGQWNTPFLPPGTVLVPGWRRMQGVVFRPGDVRFEGRTARQAVEAALADPLCVMVNRNQGSGTRVLVDQLLGAARPPGHASAPRSHNAVAAAVAQGRADWGIAIETVARSYGLGFLKLTEEHYDFALVEARRDRPGVAAFLEELASEKVRVALRARGFVPA